MRLRRVFIKRVSLAMAFVLLTAAFAAYFGGTPATAAVKYGGARGEAARLIEKVRGVARTDPSDPGAAKGWENAVTGEPLAVADLNGKISEYVVPVLNEQGKVISTIGVDAESGRWRWYSRSYNYDKFPPVSSGVAEGKVHRTLSEKGIKSAVPRPQARMAPDNQIYWHFDLGKKKSLSEAYVPAFSSGRPYTNLETRPWDKPKTYPKADVPEVPAKGAASHPVAGTRTLQSLPTAYDIPGVPYHSQQTNYWCGPASLEMIFDYWGQDVSQQEIAEVADARSPSGVYSDDLARAAHFSSQSAAVQNPALRGYTGRSLGYGVAYEKWANGSPLYARRYSDLKRLVAQNYPVLALTWYDGSHSSGHFRVVKGYSDATDSLIVNDPWYAGAFSGPDCVFEQTSFVDDLWQYSGRWAMVAAPWSVSVSKPATVSAGEQFQVDALASYRGPEPLEGEFPCAGTASLQLTSPDYSLAAGEVATKGMSGLSATGSNGSASWSVKANAAKSDTSEITAQAQGTVSGSTTSYPAGYSDIIGGAGTAASGGKSFYFAEGCTRPGYETWLSILNPEDRDASCQITYMLGTGENFDQEVTVPAHSRGTVSVNSFILQMTGPFQDVSTKVSCVNGVGIYVERSVYFEADGIRGGHDAPGVAAPEKQWYFAEGNTYDWNHEWLCLLNPASETTSASVEFLLSNGEVQTKTYELPGRARKTIDINAALSPFRGDVSMKVTSGDAIVAERPMYFAYQGRWTGGSDAMGTESPGRNWYFAEGNTRSWNDMWLCLQNPGDTRANVRVYYRTEGGPQIVKNCGIEPHSRFTIDVNKDVGPDVDLGAYLESDVPIIAERPMYFLYQGKWDGGDTVVGAQEAKKTWYFAEGCTRNEPGVQFDTWLCIQNPGSAAAAVRVSYMLGDGQILSRDYTVDPASRLTVDVNGDVGPGQDVSARVTSNVPVIVERPMYFNLRGDVGGHVVMGY